MPAAAPQGVAPPETEDLLAAPLRQVLRELDCPTGGLTETEAARRLYIQLSECLTENRPWAGRGL